MDSAWMVAEACAQKLAKATAIVIKNAHKSIEAHETPNHDAALKIYNDILALARRKKDRFSGDTFNVVCARIRDAVPEMIKKHGSDGIKVISGAVEQFFDSFRYEWAQNLARNGREVPNDLKKPIFR